MQLSLSDILTGSDNQSYHCLLRSASSKTCSEGVFDPAVMSGIPVVIHGPHCIYTCTGIFQILSKRNYIYLFIPFWKLKGKKALFNYGHVSLR